MHLKWSEELNTGIKLWMGKMWNKCPSKNQRGGDVDPLRIFLVHNHSSLNRKFKQWNVWINLLKYPDVKILWNDYFVTKAWNSNGWWWNVPWGQRLCMSVGEIARGGCTVCSHTSSESKIEKLSLSFFWCWRFPREGRFLWNGHDYKFMQCKILSLALNIIKRDSFSARCSLPFYLK